MTRRTHTLILPLRSADVILEMPAQPPVPSKPNAAATSGGAVPYDFRRSERFPADQLRALQSVHENFSEVLGSSISAYLRTRVSIGSPRIEQLSFSEFSPNSARSLTVFALRMRPQEVNAVLQLSHAALFPILEILLGGNGKSPAHIDRDITEIERIIIAPVLRIIVQELKSAWQPLSPIEFLMEEEPAARQMIASMPQTQELLAIALEVRIGEATGALNLGFPSRPIRALLQDACIRKQERAADESSKILRLIQGAQVNAEIRLNGPKMLFRDLVNIEPGDVLTFDHPLRKEVELELNGTAKFKGHIVAAGNRRAFQVNRLCPLAPVQATDPAHAAAGRFSSSE